MDRIAAPDASKRIRAALKARAEHDYRVTIDGSGPRGPYADWRGVRIESTRPHPNAGTGYGWDKYRDSLLPGERAELARLFKVSPSDERATAERGSFVIVWHELDEMVRRIESDDDGLSPAQEHHRIDVAFDQLQDDPHMHLETREEMEQRHRDEDNARYRVEAKRREVLRSLLEANGWDVDAAVQSMLAKDA